MASVYVQDKFFLYSHLAVLLFLLAGTGNGNAQQHNDCPESFDCGSLGTIRYPFTKAGHEEDCGALPIHGCDDYNKTSVKYVQFITQGRLFPVTDVDIHWSSGGVTFHVIDKHFTNLLHQNNACEAFSYHNNNNIAIPSSSSSPFGYFYMKENITTLQCNRTRKGVIIPPNNFFKNSSCPRYDFYFGPPVTSDDESWRSSCLVFNLPVIQGYELSANPFPYLTHQITIQFESSQFCHQCHRDRNGRCRRRNQSIYCATRKRRRSTWKLGLLLGGVGPWILVGLFLMLRHCKRKHSRPPHLQLQLSNSTSADPYTQTNKIFFGVPIFSYDELQQATNNFDHTRKLGDGGFGTVYYGKLKDGREVAVKQLYEHNYKRVEQFLNEIEVVTSLRHRNLVSLYGCTSRHSRELLLVYEYIPNGTVESHLHGDLSRAGLLTWPIRMQIAIETATALAYLHASDIIHRDVKTNNILLDSNFSVKVADFGLSRLFPNDVSHVSTAPQGSPGYLDPDYFQHYQLSVKSDVYSFGVVLMELISSMPVIDAARERDEINLANVGANKIRKGAIGELVDPLLGFESDSEVKRMVTSVAELAFQCVLGERELRPSMDQLLQQLKRIEGGNNHNEYYQNLEKGDEGAGSSSSEQEQVSSPTNMHKRQLSSPTSLTE